MANISKGFSHNCHFRSYSIRDRYTVRPNSSYLEEVYHGHWDQIKRDEDEIEKVMDMKWDEYVDMFGFTPAEYIGSPAYKAKYGENQVIFVILYKIQPFITRNVGTIT